MKIMNGIWAGALCVACAGAAGAQVRMDVLPCAETIEGHTGMRNPAAGDVSFDTEACLFGGAVLRLSYQLSVGGRGEWRQISAEQARSQGYELAGNAIYRLDEGRARKEKIAYHPALSGLGGAIPVYYLLEEIRARADIRKSQEVFDRAATMSVFLRQY